MKSRSKKPKTKPRLYFWKENLSSNIVPCTIPILPMISSFCCFAWICKINCQGFAYVGTGKDDGAHYYGPFAQAGMLRSTLLEMRKKFGILLSDANPVDLGGGRYKLYDDARAEIFAGHNETTVEEYGESWVQNACSFMEGRAKSWLSELRRK